MYLGRIVELAGAGELYEQPKHPYTAALLSAVPKGDENGGRRERIVLTGDVPSPVAPPPGCPFHPRCPKARLVGGSEGVPESCRTEWPGLSSSGGGRELACWYPLEPGDRLQDAASRNEATAL
jgi:peptide/nickel transport system ATP-binding protein